jgi:O-antigen ligase
MIVIISCLFINTLYFLFFFPLILALFIYKFKKQQTIKFGPADILMISICAVELMQLLFTSYTPNTVKASSVIFFGATLWFIMRLYINEFTTVNAFISIVSFLICVITVIPLLEYCRHKSQFADVGVVEMTMVKPHYRPLGLALNDWVAVLICLLPFPLYSALLNKKRIIPFIFHLISFACVNLSILVSYSRSGYISLLIFDLLLVSLSFLFCRKTIFSVIFISLFGLLTSLTVLIQDKQSVIQTSSINKTTSQRRSLDGRFKKWAEAITLFKQSPVTGVGSGNYELASRLYGSKNYNTLSYRSTNTLLQILVEKGLLGTIVYIIAFCIGCFCCVKSVRTNSLSAPFVAALFSLCVREVFFNSFFDNRIFVFFIIIFFLINLPITNSED